MRRIAQKQLTEKRLREYCAILRRQRQFGNAVAYRGEGIEAICYQASPNASRRCATSAQRASLVRGASLSSASRRASTGAATSVRKPGERRAQL